MDAERFEQFPAESDRPAAITAAHISRWAIIYIRQSSVGVVRESRDLRRLAIQWGWPERRIRVIDSDIGLPGTSTGRGRAGFFELLRLVEAGAVGIVIVQDFTRLTRDVAEFENFFAVARDSATLFGSNGVVADPMSDDIAAITRQ